jgi:hypothetical protein
LKPCECRKPLPQPDGDGVWYCGNEDCGDRVPDPLLVALFNELRDEVRSLRRLIESGNEGDGGASKVVPAVKTVPVRGEKNSASPRELPPGLPSTNGKLIGPNELARRLGRSPEWVRAHREELGVRQLGAGPKPRLWFEWAEVNRRLAQAESHEPPASEKPTRGPSRRRQSQIDLVEVKR